MSHYADSRFAIMAVVGNLQVKISENLVEITNCVLRIVTQKIEHGKPSDQRLIWKRSFS